MRAPLFLPTAVAALALLPGAAHAKGLVGAQVCGAGGCSSVDRGALRAMLPDADHADGPTTGAPFVTVRLTMREGRNGPLHRERYTYVPSRGLLRFDGAPGWMQVRPGPRAELDRLVAAVTPLPASKLEGIEPAPPPAIQPPAAPQPDGGTPWWALAGAGGAALGLLALLARYATRSLNARPRASKSVN
jgi:hypothetical protein